MSSPTLYPVPRSLFLEHCCVARPCRCLPLPEAPQLPLSSLSTLMHNSGPTPQGISSVLSPSTHLLQRIFLFQTLYKLLSLSNTCFDFLFACFSSSFFFFFQPYSLCYHIGILHFCLSLAFLSSSHTKMIITNFHFSSSMCQTQNLHIVFIPSSLRSTWHSPSFRCCIFITPVIIVLFLISVPFHLYPDYILPQRDLTKACLLLFSPPLSAKSRSYTLVFQTC